MIDTVMIFAAGFGSRMKGITKELGVISQLT
jgi:choline kinase